MHPTPQAADSDAHILAAPSSQPYRRAWLADIAADPERLEQGRPVVARVARLPPAELDVPALGFGDTDMDRAGIVMHPPGDPGAQRLGHGGCVAFLLRNAVVHGKYGVVTLGGDVMADTLQHFPIHNVPGAAWEDQDTMRLPDLPLAAAVHAGSHLLTCNLDNYYHWMIEAAARFSPAIYDTFARHPETESTPFLLLPTLDAAWKWESLERLVPASVPRMSLDARARVLVQRLLYVPDLSGAGWNPHPVLLDAFDTIRAAVPGAAAARPWRRLYISRSDSANRVLANEAEVIALAERAGFTPVLLSGLSLAEQVRLFAEASHILAPHGAGLTNIGFCQPGAVLCELHMDSYVHWTFRRLAALRGVRYGCLVGQSAGGQHGWVHSNTWRLDLAALEGVLADPRFIAGAPPAA
jgi:capsular polysaccharide biosynthesis protein